MPSYLDNHKRNRKLTTLVENRTIYNSNYAELNIFETHEASEKVCLKFDTPIIASMLTGKKIMHLKGMPSFDFFPGESVVIPANEELIIDFPIATKLDPTQCLALTIDPGKIKEIASNFNHAVAIENENNNWSIDKISSHLTNQKEVDFLIKRCVQTFTNDCKSKDMLLDLMIQELVVRLLQTKAKQSILEDLNSIFSDTRIGTVIKFINQNLTDRKLSVAVLANKAHMSSSHFHKKFKDTLGISPIEYINSERIKFSKKIISQEKNILVADVAFKSGFNSVSYFNRQFKKQELIKPSQYRKIISKNKR
jgi:AraC-like DNA-binding protein